MKSSIANRQSNITVAGAGPAGASLAIRLAQKGFKVCLIEREKFPRHKLCGEFVSPECLAHFVDLGVLEKMLAAGGERIAETRFYEPGGKSVGVASAWFAGNSEGALSVSRAEMDFRLLEKAKEAGVEVLEDTSTVGLLLENNKVCGVKAKNKTGETFEISASLTIDATGRANVLGKLAKKEISRKGTKQKREQRTKLIGFKAHLENADIDRSACEIYFFRGGYGGLSPIENNLANHCFLIKADVVKEFSGDADKIVENVIFQNKRAFAALKNARAVSEWLAVSVDAFGAKNLNPLPNLFSVGDAAAFIDPFTGSGMLMALESAEILGSIIAENEFSSERIAKQYKNLYGQKFYRRLKICSIIRRATFVPNLAKYAISVLSFSEKARKIAARSTRSAISTE